VCFVCVGNIKGDEKSVGEILTKGGARLGDALVLTKPLGTGVIFAGDMRVLARGDWVQASQTNIRFQKDSNAKCQIPEATTYVHS